MLVEYNVTLEDLVDFNLYHQKNSPSMRRSILSMKCLYIVILILLVPLLLRNDESFLVSAPVVSVIAIISACLLLFISVLSRPSLFPGLPLLTNYHFRLLWTRLNSITLRHRRKGETLNWPTFFRQKSITEGRGRENICL